MSQQSCQLFLREAESSAELRQSMKAITGVSEVVALGARHGYQFDIAELGAATAAAPAPRAAAERAAEPEPAPAPEPEETAFYHYEYDLADLPGFGPVIAELDALKVRPSSVDLAAFDGHFTGEDMDSTARSPHDPEYQRWHQRMMADYWRDPKLGAAAPRRDFHLVNLDDHVAHEGYPAYFAAKNRVIAALETFFGREVRMSGSMWYPPRSYRLWHTNENSPGWRMYVIDLDDEFTADERPCFFRYLNPATGELVTLPERRRIVRFFRAEQAADRLFWHCIVNPSPVRHRWSFGFVVDDGWRAAVTRALGTGR